MSARTFDESLAFGAEGEDRVARWLIRRGVVVLPLYQFESHASAPMLFEAQGAMTCPDLACFGGRAFFAEVKRKGRWIRWGNRMETGCNLRLWRDYCRVADRAGVSVFLFFLHDSGERQGLYFASTATLMPFLREWDGRHHQNRARISPPLALFPIQALRAVPLSEVAAAA